MGRYYSGDIEGKFWFAVQSSDDADFFGVTGSESSELNYYFDEENLDDINKGIAQCKKELGANYKKIKDFFKVHNGYNEEMIVDEVGIEMKDVKRVLEWCARLELGIKIRDCVQKNGICEFTAEL